MIVALDSSRNGLDTQSADAYLQRHGRNALFAEDRHTKVLKLFFDRFRSPLVLILIFAAVVAFLVKDWLDALIVLSIVLISALLSFFQEYRANNAVESLRQRVSVKATVVRDGHPMEIASDEVVPGDIIKLSAGDLIPADGIILEAKDFFVSQSLLTGETFPDEKQPGLAAEGASLAERHNCVFMGTSVRSGFATTLIVLTGRNTSYGQIADTLALRPPETEFERGLRRFGAMLMRIMVVIVLVVLVINIALQRSTIETVLFAMALAVGLSPELLPAILTITLAGGAKNMAKHGVIVKRLNSIENLGSMDVLCTDKTGTLTEGVMELSKVLDAAGEQSDPVLRKAFLNSHFQTGLANPLDDAVIAAARKIGMAETGYKKLDEIPYDFIRKRLSIVVVQLGDTQALMITKGALQSVLDVCVHIQTGMVVEALDEAHRQAILHKFALWSEQGYRVLGIAQKNVSAGKMFTRHDEQALAFCGFLLFFDPPEVGVGQTLHELSRLGVRLKIITGDNRFVARHVADAVGIKVKRIVTGAELDEMKDEALWHLAPQATIFAEVDPNQKERIITALQKTGHVVGYIGDGINDAPALHVADVGISVDHAVDVAKEAADFVLLEHDLDVVRKGIEEGRHTFANTLKYIFITTSANFGNMISMALASLFLPFLPMLAKQILLNNFLSDIPAMGIGGDSVDRNWEHTPHRWNIKLIRNFMITFGLESTLFDVLTFAALLYLAGEVTEIFRTGWFVESLLTELLILFVIRTYKPFYKSKAGRFLVWSAAGTVLLTLMLPYLSIGSWFGFVPLPGSVMVAVLIITGLYIAVSEATKHAFFRHFEKSHK